MKIRKILAVLFALASGPALSQGIPIGALPNATLPLAAGDYMIVSQNGTTVKATVSAVNAEGVQTVTLTGDCTGSGTTTVPVVCTKTNGVVFGYFATGTNGANLTGTIPATVIPTTAVGAGPYGSATQVATFTVGTDGRLTAAANVAISGVPPSGAAGGDLGSTYPNPTVVATHLTAPQTLAQGGTASNLAATGGTSQVLQQSSVGAAVTVGQLSAASLSNGTTGSGPVVLATAPAISGATFSNPTWTGTLSGAAVQVSGQITSTVATGSAPLVVASTTNVANLNASSLSGSAVGTSGATIPLLNGTNTWTGTQTFSPSVLKLGGAASGTITLTAPSAAGSNTITFPAGTTNFSATGGASQVLQQTSSGGAITVGQLSAASLSDGTTGTVAIVLANAPTLSGAALTNTTTWTGTLSGALLQSTNLQVNGSTIPTNGIYLPAANTVGIAAAGGLAASVTSTGINNTVIGATTPLGITGSIITASTRFVGTELNTNSSSSLNLKTSGGTQVIVVDGGASTVNAVYLQGGTTGNPAQIRANGGDSNVQLSISSRGTSKIQLQTNSGTAQVEILHTAGATNLLDLTGSNGGAPSITTTGGGLAINSSAGTTTLSDATLKFPNIPSSAAAQTGYLCFHITNGLTYDTGATCLISSARFKKDIKTLEHGLTDVMKLKPASYMRNLDGEDWLKNDPNANGEQIGLIAEDVAEVDDRLVERDKDGRPLKVRYEQSVALLVRAIQEQQAQIEGLKTCRLRVFGSCWVN